MDTDLDLDAKGFEVLESIYEQGGEASTTEVKEYTGIEKNAIIHYRFDKLEEQGLLRWEPGKFRGTGCLRKLLNSQRQEVSGSLMDCSPMNSRLW